MKSENQDDGWGRCHRYSPVSITKQTFVFRPSQTWREFWPGQLIETTLAVRSVINTDSEVVGLQLALLMSNKRKTS